MFYHTANVLGRQLDKSLVRLICFPLCSRLNAHPSLELYAFVFVKLHQLMLFARISCHAQQERGTFGLLSLLRYSSTYPFSPRSQDSFDCT
jgi:hypothetical protein